ncbi:MAG: chorismate mutase [Parachlamydiales bacterium]|nr:chorismate mutase [Parachlamydiales bacterium]
MNNSELIDIRNQIDLIDDQIISLLEKRLMLAKKLAENKLKKQIVDEKRENEILSKIKSKNIQEIYKSIFNESKKIQKN